MNTIERRYPEHREMQNCHTNTRINCLKKSIWFYKRKLYGPKERKIDIVICARIRRKKKKKKRITADGTDTGEIFVIRN